MVIIKDYIKDNNNISQIIIRIMVINMLIRRRIRMIIRKIIMFYLVSSLFLLSLVSLHRLPLPRLLPYFSFFP